MSKISEEPVAAVTDAVESTDERIVVGVDGSPSSIAAFRRGIRISTALKVPLQVVSAWSYPVQAVGYLPVGYSPEQDAKDELAAIVSTVLGDTRPAGFAEIVREGPPADVLIEESKGAGMLIVGSRGHSGIAGLLLGSVSSACAERASCPVLITHEREADEAAEDVADAERADKAASLVIGGR